MQGRRLSERNVLQANNIKTNLNRVREIKGDDNFANSLILENGSKFDFDGLFVALGVASSLDFARQLGLETLGDFIVVDTDMHTSNKKVWAIGMARGGVNQIVKSVGDGAVAAVNIIKVSKGLPNYIDHT